MSKELLMSLQAKVKQLQEWSTYPKLDALAKTLGSFISSNKEDEGFTRSMQGMYTSLIYDFARTRQYEKSALMHAAEKGYLGLMLDLLSVPTINVDEQFEPATGWGMLFSNELSAEGGYTALMYAVRAGQKEAADLLIRHYANTQMMNDKKQTAFDLIDDENDGVSPLPADPLLIQKEQFLLDLIACDSEEKLAFLVEKQAKLKMTKEEIVQHMLFTYSDDVEESLKVLNQAVELNESCTAPASMLAKYMREDKTTISRIEDRIEDLMGQRQGVKETYLLRGRGLSAGRSESSSSMSSHGPQDDFYDSKNEESLNVNNSKFF